MVKKRIYELAKELGISSERVTEIAKKYDFKVTNHMSALDENEQNKICKSWEFIYWQFIKQSKK